jgi:hypothetical protein
MAAAARVGYNEAGKEADMAWRPSWIGFILSFVLLALPRVSYACPA